jgi:hypothetical protein
VKVGDLVKHKRKDTHLVGIIVRVYMPLNVTNVTLGTEYSVQWIPTHLGRSRCTAGVLEVLNETR